MTKVVPPESYERGIATLLTDSISLARESEDHHDVDHRNTLARASVVTSMLYLEACANGCLAMLDLGTRLTEELDKLSTIAKFDVFLRIKFRGRAIDRSHKEYQGFMELKNLRDAMAHPKAQKFERIKWTPKSSASKSPQSSSLKLSKIPAYCSTADAITALRASHQFAAYFFRDCCRFRPKQVSALIHSEDDVPDLSNVITPLWYTSLKAWLEDNSIDVSYMSINWHPD